MHTSVASAATQKTDWWEKCHSSAGGQKLHVQIRSQLGQMKVASECRNIPSFALLRSITKQRVLTQQPVLAHHVHLEGDPCCVVIKGCLAGVKARILRRDLRLEHHRVSIHLDEGAITPENFIHLLIIGEMLHFYFTVHLILQLVRCSGTCVRAHLD